VRGHYIQVCSNDSIGVYIPKSKKAFADDIKYEHKIITIDTENLLFFKKLVISGVDIVFV